MKKHLSIQKNLSTHTPPYIKIETKKTPLRHLAKHSITMLIKWEKNSKILTNNSSPLTQTHLTKLTVLIPLIGWLFIQSTSSLWGITGVGTSDFDKAILEHEQLIIQDQNRLRFDQTIREKYQQEKPQERFEIPEQIKPTIIEGETPSFNITNIILKKAHSLSWRQKRNLKKPYLKKALTINDINQLAHDITNLYIKKGYITTRAYIPKQNLNSGILVININEGFIEDIFIQNANKLQTFSLFPFLIEESLNIRDIEQGLDQLNRLQSNHGRTKLIPSEVAAGGTIVVIENQTTNKGSASIRYDTLSKHKMGILPNSIDLSYDNLIALNDQWYLNYSQSFKDTVQYNNSFSINTSIPWQYITINGSISQFDYLTIIKGLSRYFNATGKTKTITGGINMVLHRNSIGKTTITGDLITKDTVSFIEDTQSDTGTRKLVIAKLGWKQTIKLRIGTFQGNLNYSQGFPYLNATQDTSSKTYTDPKAQYRKLNGSLLWQKGIMQANWYGQYSYDSLYSSEQISIGDFSSVPGYNNSLQGDHGIIAAHSLSYFPFKKRFKTISISHAIHTGIIHNKGGLSLNDNIKKGHMGSVSTSLSHYKEGLSIKLTIAKAVKASSFITKPSHIIYANITKRFI